MTNGTRLPLTCCLFLTLSAFNGHVLADQHSIGDDREAASDIATNESDEPEPTADMQEADADIMSMDVASSILDATNRQDLITFGGDIRSAYSNSDTDLRQGGSERDDEITGRLRLNGSWNPFETLRFTARAAFICSTNSCSPDISLDSNIAGNSVEAGKITLDEFFLQWFRTAKFDLAVGRLQTRFVARGGVFAKSLDRNNSHNTTINWTDGIHGTIKPGLGRGWVAHLISEYNDDDGTGSIRRAPLDFSDGDSELSHFVAFENIQPWGYILQRGLDISYLPHALLKDGLRTGRREDYWGFVARLALRAPQRATGRRLRFAGEVGYAPETPTRQAVGIGGGGDSDGLAWNASISLMDFIPKHSIGFLYGQTGAGWLLSPQYDNNEEQIELRWSWRPDANFIIAARVRQREELDQLVGTLRKNKEFDYFVRATWRYAGTN